LDQHVAVAASKEVPGKLVGERGGMILLEKLENSKTDIFWNDQGILSHFNKLVASCGI